MGSCRTSAHLPPSSSGIGDERGLQPAAEARVRLAGSDGGVPLVAASAADRAGAATPMPSSIIGTGRGLQPEIGQGGAGR